MPFNRTRWAMTALLAAVAAGPALAGGFQIQQQGAKASGRGGAFTAQADDASAAYYNPAAVGQLGGWNLYLGDTYMVLGNTTFDAAAGGSVDSQDDVFYPGTVYFTGRLGGHYAFSVGAFVPFALRSHWLPQDPVSTSAQKTRWIATAYNANFIARLNDEWNLAVGYEMVRFTIDDFSRSYDFTRLASFIQQDGAPLTAQQNITMAGNKAGVDAAIHYKGKNGNRFGFSFRSQKVLQLDGRERWSEVSQQVFIPGATPVSGTAGCYPDPNNPSATICPIGTAFTDSKMSGSFVLPATALVGFGQEGLGNWDWEADILWTHWKNFDSIDFTVQEEDGIVSGLAFIPTTTDFHQRETWGDTLGVNAGFDYHFNERHTARGGLSYDPSPIDEELSRPYNPDADKVGITGGYGWDHDGGRVKVDAFGQIWLYSDRSPEARPTAGVVGGSYETTVLAVGASIQYHF